MTNREIDIEVADAIGQRRCNCHPLRPSPRFSADTGLCLNCEAPLCPRYTTDPVASKQLRDKMRADGWSWSLERVVAEFARASFFKAEEDGEFVYADSDTEEMAVALAALKAVRP